MPYIGKKPADIIATAVDTTTGQFSGTLDVTGETTLSANLNLGDDDKAIFGADDDLQIYHNASNSYVQDVGTGKLHITSNGTGVSIDKGTSELMATFDTDGAVELYYDGGTYTTPKLATTSSGIQVTGNIANASGDLTLDVAGQINLDADSGNMKFRDGGVDIGLFTNDATNFVIRSEVSDKDLIFRGNDGGSFITALTLDMSAGGTATFNKNVKLPDNGIISLGVDGDLTLFSDGTNGNIGSPNGELTLDVAGNIILDAGGGSIILKEDGTSFGELTDNTGGDFDIKCPTNNADIRFKGVDGGVNVTALRLDMSDAGTAVFNHNVKLGADDSFLSVGASDDFIMFHDGIDSHIFNSTGEIIINNAASNEDIVFKGNYGGSEITALTLNMGIDGIAQFKDKIQCNSINTGSSAGTLTMFGGGTNKGGTIELSGGNNTGSTGAGIVFKTGASTSSPSEKMRIDQYGHVTMPYQSAFAAKVTSQQSNFALSSQVTVLFATELYDQNSDYNNSTYTFTAPVTGKYQLNVLILLNNVDTVPGYYQTQLTTPNRTYYNTHDPRGYSQDITYHNLNTSILADMDAGDTAYVRVYQAGGTQQTDIDAESYFTGYLVC